jgi:hypothetical protein
MSSEANSHLGASQSTAHPSAASEVCSLVIAKHISGNREHSYFLDRSQLRRARYGVPVGRLRLFSVMN